jgi:GxxExxY protein
MDTHNHKFEGPLADEVYAIVGAAFEVSNQLGCGLFEKSYENALVVEFNLQDIPHVQQQHFDVHYKSVKIGEYIPDLIAYGLVVIDTKTVAQIGNNERAQMLNYLKITDLKAGLILNFKHQKLEWERLVH